MDENEDYLNMLKTRKSIVYDSLSFFNLKPYIYKPVQGIILTNQNNGQASPIFHEINQNTINTNQFSEFLPKPFQNQKK
jgi:hypothetical protein